MGKKILMVVTNHTDMQEGKKTGIWLSEFAEAYMAFQENGYEITVASPKGGTSPIDPAAWATKHHKKSWTLPSIWKIPKSWMM